MGRATGARRSPDGWDGAQSWLDRVGTLRDHVRQVLVQRQLQGLLDDRGVASGHALDVGAGQGTQAMWLADVGWQVDAVEPDRVVVPDDPDEVAALLDAELALGAHDPYRQLAPLVHVMARRSGERGRHG